MSALSIRPTKNWEEIAPLIRMLQTMHADARPDIHRAFDESAAKAEFLAAVQKKEDTFLAAQMGEETAGYIHLAVHRRPTSNMIWGRKVLLIEELGVFPQFRGLGIGSRLMEEARKTAAEKGCKSIELCVWNFNEEAYRFYEKQGFFVQRRIMEMAVTENNGGSD